MELAIVSSGWAHNSTKPKHVATGTLADRTCSVLCEWEIAGVVSEVLGVHWSKIGKEAFCGGNLNETQ